MTQLLNLLETQSLDDDDQAILNQSGIDKRIGLQLSENLAWAKRNGFTYAGHYEDDPTITNSRMFVYFSGKIYFTNQSLTLPYTIDSTTYSHPDNDSNLYKIREFNANDTNIGTGETNYAAGNHTHVQSDITDLSGFIEEVVEDTTPQLGGKLDLNGNFIEDNVYNIVRFDAAETRLTQTTSANCQQHIYSSFESDYPSGVAGYFLNSWENFGEDEFYIKKQNNSNIIQVGSDIDTNSIGVFSPLTSYNGLSGVVNQVNTSADTLTSGAAGIYINIATGSTVTTLSSTIIDDKYRGNIIEFVFPYASGRTVVNNTGLPLTYIKPGETFTTIANGGSFGMSNCGRFIQTTSSGGYNLFISF